MEGVVGLGVWRSSSCGTRQGRSWGPGPVPFQFPSTGTGHGKLGQSLAQLVASLEPLYQVWMFRAIFSEKC